MDGAGDKPERRSIAGLVAFAVIAVVALSLAFRDDPTAGTANTCEAVTYSVTASRGFSVTLRNATGDTEQRDIPRTSWSTTYRCFNTGSPTYVSAQLDGAGRISCEIIRDGIAAAEATSNGEFVIASCSD